MKQRIGREKKIFNLFNVPYSFLFFKVKRRSLFISNK